MEQLKAALVDHKWIFPILVPRVNEKLCSALNVPPNLAKQASMTYLTASLYRNKIARCELPIQSPQLSLSPIYSNSTSGTYFSEQIKLLFNDCILLAEDQLPIYIPEWLSTFRKFCTENAQLGSLNNFLEYALFLDRVQFRGASHPHFLGSLFLHISPSDSIFDFLVSLIHESAHQELFLINFTDRLVNEKYDFNLIHAPYQNKARPPIGRLHSLHALFRMIQFVVNFDPHNEKLPFFISKFNQNINSFALNELTEFGAFLKREVYEPFSEQI